MRKKRVIAKRGKGPKPMEQKLAAAKKIPLRGRPGGQLAASAGGRMVSLEVSRMTCRRLVHELVDLADERHDLNLYVEALDNAIRLTGCRAQSKQDLLKLRDVAWKELAELEAQIRQLIEEVDP